MCQSDSSCASHGAGRDCLTASSAGPAFIRTNMKLHRLVLWSPCCHCCHFNTGGVCNWLCWDSLFWLWHSENNGKDAPRSSCYIREASLRAVVLCRAWCQECRLPRTLNTDKCTFSHSNWCTLYYYNTLYNIHIHQTITWPALSIESQRKSTQT